MARYEMEMKRWSTPLEGGPKGYPILKMSGEVAT